MWRKFNKIKTKISWSLFGNIIYALSQWIIITLIAKFGASEDLGKYSLALAVTAPIVLFFNFQLRTILATDIKNEYKFTQYLGSRILHLTFSFLFIIPISLLYAGDKETVLLIILMGLVKYFESISDICMGYFQKKRRIDLVGKSQLYRGILTTVVVGMLYVSTNNLLLAILGLLIVMIMRIFVYDLKHIKKFGEIVPAFDLSWINLLKMAFPLGVVSLINSLNTNIPKYFLEYYSGVSSLGIYSALSYILIAGSMLITPISLLVGPKLATLYNQKDIKKFIKINILLSLISLFIFSIIISIVYFQGENILNLLYGNEYAVYNNVFIITTFAMCFSFITTFLNLSIVAARYFKIQPIINFIVTIITFIASIYLVNNLNILGASYTLLISKASQTFFSLVVLIYAIKNIKK